MKKIVVLRNVDGRKNQKLFEEIKANPNEEIYRKILSLIAMKTKNNVDLFNDIIKHVTPEILEYNKEQDEKNLLVINAAQASLKPHKKEFESYSSCLPKI